MNKFLSLFFLLFLIICGLLLNPYEAPAKDSYATTAPILDTAEKFFISLKQRQYGVVWEMLSTKSHNTIVNDIYKASKKLGEHLEKTTIQDAGGGSHFWDAVLSEFDPDMILEESSWEMGPVKKNKAEIIILYKTSKNPVILQMFKEKGGWKVGFTETFWTRKL